MEAELPVQVMNGHIRQSAKRPIDATHNLVHHAAQLLILRDICAARNSNLSNNTEGQAVMTSMRHD